jgi:DNA primase
VDNYSALRSLLFAVFAPALGIDTNRFKRKRDEWSGYCPVHNSKSNNACFNYSDTGKWHCFSCGSKGAGAIDLTKAVKQVGFKEACALLEPLVGAQPLQLPPQTEKTAPGGDSEVLRPLAKDTWRKFAVESTWLKERIPDAAVLERYGVFCYNNPARKSVYSGRVMLPVKSADGVLYGYLGRYIGDIPGDNAKYLFPKGLAKGRFLFGADVLKSQHQLPVRVLYLVESCFSVMRLASLGMSSVSPYGWSVSDDQIGILATLAKGVVYLPDRNKVQESAGVIHRLAQHLWVKAPPLPEGVDDPEFATESQLKAL